MAIQTKYRQIKSHFSIADKLFKKIVKMEPTAVANFIPLTWHKAKDFSVWDEHGNKWIDLTSGIFVANAGHANPKIKKAVKDQIDLDLLFAYNYPTKIKHRFLSKLLTLSPPYFNRAILLNSGSEVMDIAYKLLKLYGQSKNKKYIITFNGAYHGRGLSNDLISGSSDKAVAWSGVRDEAVKFLNFPYNQNDKFDPSKLSPVDQIAGFVIETFQGWGAWFYPRGFINDLYRFAKKAGALICFDEMQAGFYRLGPLYGYMTYGSEIKPDIIALGKGISSSLPMAAVLSREELVNLDPGADLHGTQSANTLCCAASLANLEFLSSAKEIKRRSQTFPIFEQELQKMSVSPLIKQVNVRGMIAALIFHEAKEASRVVKSCIENGVLPVCTNRESIKIAPPLTITKEAIKEFAAVIKNFL